MRWHRSKYLWTGENRWLEKLGIKVEDSGHGPQDVLVIPCPHLPGKETMSNRDEGLWINTGHRGLFEFSDDPVICDSSLDYAYIDPAMRATLSSPQMRAFLTGTQFRNPELQTRGSFGGEYYGAVYANRWVHGDGPSTRRERAELHPDVLAKIPKPNRPPTRPFTDEVFEYIQQNRKPLEQRSTDLFFSGRTQYLRARFNDHPTMHRKRFEEMWDSLPGARKQLITYDDFAGTRKAGKPTTSLKYPYEYVDALLDSKVIVSPWGWSPWCVRDFEALACGCVVIKPECSNMLVYPDIYDPDKNLMLWGDLMYDNLHDQIRYCYENLDEMQSRVDRASDFVFDALYPNDRLYESWTRDLRELLERILSTSNFMLGSNIP